MRPDHSNVVVVTGTRIDADNWLYRGFVGNQVSSDEITFVAYDEITSGVWPKVNPLPRELLTCVWPIGGGMTDVIIRYLSEEKQKRHDDGMRKQLESDRQHAQLDLPREVTNRKARRAAAAAKRRRS